MQPDAKDRIRLQHMLDAGSEAIRHAHGRVRTDLETDRQLEHSLVRCLEVVGEAANNVSVGLRESHPEIEWKQLVSMRNRLVHAYFSTNLRVVWRTTTEELPPLVAALATILSGGDSDAPEEGLEEQQ